MCVCVCVCVCVCACVLLTIGYDGDRIKENEISRPYGTNVEKKKCIQGLVGET